MWLRYISNYKSFVIKSNYYDLRLTWSQSFFFYVQKETRVPVVKSRLFLDEVFHVLLKITLQ